MYFVTEHNSKLLRAGVSDTYTQMANEKVKKLKSPGSKSLIITPCCKSDLSYRDLGRINFFIFLIFFKLEKALA